MSVPLLIKRQITLGHPKIKLFPVKRVAKIVASRVAANKNIFENVIFHNKKLKKKKKNYIFLQKEKKLLIQQEGYIHPDAQPEPIYFRLALLHHKMEVHSSIECGWDYPNDKLKKYTIKVIDSTHIAGIAC